IFCNGTAIFLREHHNHMYSVITYYMSQICIRIPVSMVISMVFISIVYFMAGLNPDSEAFAICVGNNMLLLIAGGALVQFPIG
ncbi:unnamed protein product, partial [Medioppia subpectinata]